MFKPVLFIILILSLHSTKTRMKTKNQIDNDFQNININAINSDRLDSKYIQTQNLKIGSIEINNQKVKLQSNTIIRIGSNSFQASELINMIDFVKKAQRVCGVSMEKCIPNQQILQNLDNQKQQSKMRFIQMNSRNKEQEQESEIKKQQVVDPDVNVNVNENESQLDEQVEEILD